MFLPLLILSSTASFTFGKDCLVPFLCFFILFCILYTIRNTVFADYLTVTVYVGAIYAFSILFGVKTGVFLCLTSFASALFGRKGIMRASSVISALSFLFLVLCLVFREEPAVFHGKVRYVTVLLSALSCAKCTCCGFFKTLIPLFCGFLIGVIFGICGGIFAEIFAYASSFCTLSALFSSLSVFKKQDDGTYNENG